MLSEETFANSFEQVRPGLLRFIAARVRDTHAARDLLQEVHAKAFRNRERFDDARPFSTWVYAIARNACVDHLRRRLRDPLAAVAPNAPVNPPDLDTLPNPGDGDPGLAAESRELSELVRREIRRLPERHRAALEMKILDDLTYREIAEALGAPLGTVAFWVKAAIESIADRLRHLR